MINLKELHNKNKLKRNVRNDLIKQTKDAQRIVLKSEELKRREEVNNCNHEFIVYAKGNKKHEEIIECVHCGLTNKYTLYESFLNQKNHGKRFLYDVYYNEDGKVESFETKLFKEVVNGIKLNYMSFDEFRCDHARVLYALASNLADDPEDNSQVFYIMNELKGLEDDFEEIYIKDIKDTKYLLKKYKDKKIAEYDEEKNIKGEKKYIKL